MKLEPKGKKRNIEIAIQLCYSCFLITGVLGDYFSTKNRYYFLQSKNIFSKNNKKNKANKIDTFKYAFEDMFLNKLIERMDQNQDIFDKIIENKSFGNLVKEMMMKAVYSKINDAA